MLPYLLQGISLGLSAAASPGPYQAFLIGQALKNGWRRTLPAALAPLVTDGPIIALMLLVLTRMPDGVLRLIQLAGGVFVLHLAWKSLQGYRNFRPAPVSTESRQTFWQAVMMNFLSPGPYIFWSLLAGPVLVRAWHETPIRGLAFLSGFYCDLIGGMALLVVLFGAARQLGPRVNRILLGLSALALFGFGIYQLWQWIVG